MDNENKNNCQCNHNDEQENNDKGCGCDHEHEHENEGCCCGHDHEEHEMIHITLDDDTILNCFIIGTFEVEDTSYIALLPEEDGDVLLYRYHELEDEEIELSNIESEEEFNTVSEAFYELFGDDEEYDDDEA